MKSLNYANLMFNQKCFSIKNVHTSKKLIVPSTVIEALKTEHLKENTF